MKKITLLVWLLLVATAFADGTSGGGGGGGGGGAPVDSTYFVKSSEGGLSAESVVQIDGTGVSVTYNTVPDPDTVTFALDVADNITWTGTWTNQGVFLNSAASSFASSVTFNSGGYLLGVGSSAPTEAAGSGIIYYDNTTNKWRVSQDNGGYADLVQAGGTDLTGVNFLTTSATALLSAENVLTAGVGVEVTTGAGLTTLSLDTTTALTDGNDHSITAGSAKFGANGIVFEGATANNFETVIAITDPTSDDNLITVPNAEGTVVLTGQTGNVDGTMILDNTVTGADIALTSQATGDIMRYNGTDWVRVAAGAEDDVLTIASGQPAWAASDCAPGGGAAADASYIVTASSTDLTEEKVIQAGIATAVTVATIPDPDTFQVDVVADESTISVATGEIAIIESGVELLLDLNQLQGAVTDAQVPNTITINTAAAATALAANGANCSAGSYPLGVDASGAVESCTSAASFAPSTKFQLYDDFLGTTGGAAVGWGNTAWAQNISGTGTAVATSSTLIDGNHPGVLSTTTGSTTTGRAGLSQSAHQIILGSGETVFEAVFRFEELSAVAEEYITRIGLCDNNTGDCVDGVYFEYDRLTSTSFQIVTASSTNRTREATDTVVAADTWYRASFTVNAAGNSVAYSIDGVTATNSPVTTNIPTGAGRNTSPYLNTFKSAGSTPVLTYIDYYFLSQVVAR